MKQIAITLATAALLATGALTFANSQDASAQKVAGEGSEDVFVGKAVIITATPGVAGEPKQNIRVENLAGRKFLIYKVNTDSGESYDYWRAADEISRIRVFDTMEEATAYYKSRREKGVFH